MKGRCFLVAATDDFLLEEGISEAIAAVTQELPGVKPEELADQATPENVALELCSPSLFDPERLFVLPEVRSWLDTTTPSQAQAIREKPDIAPLLETLKDGVPDGMALVMGSWCGRKPKGALVDLVSKVGHFQWLPAPPPPKPWEDVELSHEQKTVLSRILKNALQGAEIEKRAESLLMERLGFKPRQLAQETSKLAIAAAGRPIDEKLIRSLVLPKERSLEVIRDALLKADFAPVFDLLSAGSAGHTIVDYGGKSMDAGRVAPTVLATICNLLHQFLFLRRLAVTTGLDSEMTQQKTSRRGWQNSHFKPKIAPALEKKMKTEMPFPKSRTGKQPSTWTLGQLFAAASRYSEDQLIVALAQAGDIEARTRGPMALEHLAAWLTMLAKPR